MDTGLSEYPAFAMKMEAEAVNFPEMLVPAKLLSSVDEKPSVW
jgi:hypothetical protein